MTKKIEQPDVDAEASAPVEEAKPKKVKKTSFDVYNGATLVRTYSVEAHGEDAEALAKEFCGHTGYTIV